MHEVLMTIVFISLLICLLGIIYFKKEKEARQGVDFVIGAAVGKKEFQESKARQVIAKGLTKVKYYDHPILTPIVNMLNPRFNYDGDFDSITHDMLDGKKERLNALVTEEVKFSPSDLNLKGELDERIRPLLNKVWTRILETNNENGKHNLKLALREIKHKKQKGETPAEILKNSINTGMCLYDKEIEILSSLVLNDEDPILYSPFFNEDLTEQEIRVQIMKVMRAELSQYPKEVQDDYYDGKEGTSNIDFQIKNKTIDKIKEMYQDTDQRFLNNVLRKYIEFE